MVGLSLVVSLQFVQVVVQGWDALLQPLALAGLCHDLERLGGAVAGVSRENLPVVKHTLREGLPAGVGAQVSGETWKERGCKTLDTSREPHSFEREKQNKSCIYVISCITFRKHLQFTK